MGRIIFLAMQPLIKRKKDDYGLRIASKDRGLARFKDHQAANQQDLWM